MMKNFTKLFALLAVMLGFSLNSSAQDVTSTATPATATIVAPIAIADGTDLMFGNIITDGSVGTVVIAPDGVRTATGGARFSSTLPGTFGASSFVVTGEGNSTYAITLPADGTISLAGPATSTAMTLSNFTSVGGTLTAGTETLTVGATLNVGATQLPGAYAGTYTVTVSYN